MEFDTEVSAKISSSAPSVKRKKSSVSKSASNNKQKRNDVINKKSKTPTPSESSDLNADNLKLDSKTDSSPELKTESSDHETTTAETHPDAVTVPETADTKPTAKENEDYLMRFQTSQALQIKTLLDVLKDLITEVNIKFDPEHMRLVSLDPGRVGMVYLLINKLEYYFCHHEIYVGVYIQYLYRLLRSVTTSHHLEWRIRKDTPSILEIVVSNPEKRTFTTHRLKTLELDIEDVTIPHVTFEYVISMPSADLQKYIKELSHVSNILTVRNTGTNIEFAASGDLGETVISVSPTPSGLNWVIKNTSDECFDSRFFVKYLERFVKTQCGSILEMYIKPQYPLILKYQLTLGQLTFCVSPISPE